MKKSELTELIKEVLSEEGGMSTRWGRKLDLESPRDHREHVAQEFDGVASAIREIRISDYPSVKYDTMGLGQYKKDIQNIHGELMKLSSIAKSLKEKIERLS